MVTAGTIIGGSFRLLRERIASVAIWALLSFAMNIAVFFAIRPVMRGMMAQQALHAPGTAPDPAALLSEMGQMFGVYAVLMLGLVMLFTAALRAALRPEDRGLAYLRLGMDELRILGVAAILGVGFFIFYVLLVLVASLIGAAIGVLARDALFPVIAILTIGVVCALVILQVRFSLTFALTLLRGKIVIGESWSLTKGRFWTLFGAYFVVGLIVFASAMLVFAISAGPYLAEIGQAGFRPAAIDAAQQHQMARQFGAVTPLTALVWLLSAVLGAGWIALAAGATGIAAAGSLDDAFGDVAAIYE